MIEFVAKRIGGIRALYPTDQVADATKGITNSSFAQWIEKEEKPKDFNPPIPEKYEGRGNPIVQLLHFKQRMSLKRILEALTNKLFVIVFIGKALSWFSQLPKGSISIFTGFNKKFLEQYHSNRPQQKSMENLHIKQRYDKSPRNYLKVFMELAS